MIRLFLLTLLLLIPFFGFSQNQTELWGIASDAGNDAGIVFKTNGDGDSLTVVHSFEYYPGKSPKYTNLCKADNGKLYGMTASGGFNNNGVIFEYDQVANIYTRKFNFDGAINGRAPNGSLIKGNNGKLYGMTSMGGVNGSGVLFEFDPVTNVFVKKFDFSQPMGSYPQGSLLLADNGKMYGMTSQGGGTLGVLFEYDPNINVYTKKHEFNNTNGATPIGSLIQAANGKLYGVTTEGGQNDFGVIFEYDILSDSLRPILSMTNALYGQYYVSMIQASNGKFYGLTTNGGESGEGTIFEFDMSIPQYFCTSFGYGDGSFPTGTLIEASNGKLYGTTTCSSQTGTGVIFEYDTSTHQWIKKVEFSEASTGAEPGGALIQDSTGLMYGLTTAGGSTGFGVLFEYDLANNTLTKKVDLSSAPQGNFPTGAITQASNGKLYGLTYYGGEISDNGVLFEYDMSTGTLTNKHEFSTTSNGQYPYLSALVETSTGKLYGTTSAGGVSASGVIFEYDPLTNIFTKKINFGGTYGAQPTGKLLIASNGKMYGTTRSGGTNNSGVLYEYDPSTNIITNKLNFSASTSGSEPYGSLIQATNGKIYGMTSGGITYGNGTFFEYDPATSTFLKKMDFDGVSKGRIPHGSLLQASNGKLYGMTTAGGAYDHGVLFEYDLLTSTFTKKLDFDSTSTGKHPYGSLIESSNGKLYAITTSGGAYDRGVLFEFNPITSTFIKKSDLNDTIGSYPFSDLVEVYPVPQFTCNMANVVTPTDSNATFIVSAVGYGLSYQWQVNDGSKGFADISDDTTYTGATNDTLIINQVNCSMNHYQYRCVVTASQPHMSIVSNVVSLIAASNSYYENMEICDGESYFWHGTSYSLSGNYQDSYSTASGCDSIYILQLEVLPKYLFSSNQDICDGEVYNWRGNDYSVTGIYHDSLTSVNGCDSVFALDLSVHSPMLAAIIGLDSMYCIYNSSDSINGNPAGGSFYGQGISGSIFNPGMAGIGNWPIVYLYTDVYGCESSDTISVAVDECTSISETESKYHVFPNPAKNELHIDFPGDGKYIVSLINPIGQILLSQQFENKQQADLDLSGLREGTYMLKIETTDGFVLKRVVIER
ncbi:MAG: hypothetical protein A2W93_05760 [Bacteroidetes bacterium GWF2_43_63]|nr:MAG: hypothetical protein A2W94_04255 [Bacteroidetes bacterium GWE2_42_42]OFY55925.1 MAG: hypothetical protein A2W93_05760 [Bacteroidetes bacterium GWF2_43_63]HCB61073.1 hypothetical protein [Bacteroidales bacterium]HCY22253.1 hypothetical protein [Bacteroidales bacterium]